MTRLPKLDAVDLRLLNALQEDARMSMDDLAERARISVPACYRRIRRLRETRAIEREVALVKPQVMGWPLMMIVLVTLESERGGVVDRFIQKLGRIPEIVEAWFVTGERDFVLRFVARDMEQFDELTRSVFYSDENIRSFDTLVVMRHAKTLSPIPVPD